ncbi:MAG: ABC transporter ATP-binding protein, partial [Lachnospiraceae bacterium]|nr:ABC transporter ATP-binding protein [Lachnospiraceae bacterium]
YFLDRTVRRIFAFQEDGTLTQSEGGYTDYAKRKSEISEEEVAANMKSCAADKTDRNNWNVGRKKKLKFTYQEQKDYETIETDIALLEEKIEALEAEIPKHSRDFVKLNELMQEKESCEQMLEEKMERWMYLEDLVARIEAGEEV